MSSATTPQKSKKMNTFLTFISHGLHQIQRTFFPENWNGYKLHIDTADNGIPISALLTSASVHDSQVAIPLATITARRIQNLYDLMDSAYDVPEIEEHSRQLQHVPLIDVNPRRNAGLKEALELEPFRQTKRPSESGTMATSQRTHGSSRQRF